MLSISPDVVQPRGKPKAIEPGKKRAVTKLGAYSQSVWIVDAGVTAKVVADHIVVGRAPGRAPSVPLTRRVIAMLWPPVVAGLGVVYLAAVILVALAVYGVR